MFEPVIASIAFVVLALVILGIGIAAAVRRRMNHGERGAAYRSPQPAAGRAPDSARGEEERRERGSRAVNE